MPRLTRQYHDLSVPITEFRFTVQLPEDGTRVDVVLRDHYPWRSREHFQGMIDQGDVHVNDLRPKAATRCARRIVGHLDRHTMRAYYLALVRYAELIEGPRGVLHHRPVGDRTHRHPDQRVRVRAHSPPRL